MRKKKSQHTEDAKDRRKRAKEDSAARLKRIREQLKKGGR